MRRPTRAELEAARGATVPDVVADGLRLLFCGINPGLYSAAAGHHFAGPSNRFWRALHLSGLTPRRLSPCEERELLEHRIGVTNLVGRATASASELTTAELRRGAEVLEEKVERRHPERLAILGLGAFREAFGRRESKVGRQHDTVGGAELWVLPNPSGLNAHYRLEDFARLFRELGA